MTIGIKYCGGCNPRFERADIALELQEKFPLVIIQRAFPNEVYDFIVVVCGCTSRCAHHQNLNAKIEKYVLGCKEELPILFEKITNALNTEP